MTTIAPYKALHYNPEMFSDLTPVIVPPYDNIPKGDDEKYWKRSPYNLAHLILPKKENEDYVEAAKLLQQWQRENILKETAPAYFLYQQDFEAYGHTYSRRTLLCTVQLRDFKEKIVRPHENTFGKYKADRLKKLKSTQANLSHIFMMVADKEKYLDSHFDKWSFEKPFLKGKSDEGVTHTLWKKEVSGKDEIAEFFSSRPIYIVDGHHRYESSLNYAKELGVVGTNHPAAQMMIAVANAYDPGLVVFPTHRLIKKGLLGQWDTAKFHEQYELTPMTYEELKVFVTKESATPQFGLYLEGKLNLCRPKNWEAATEIKPKAVRKLSVTWSDHKFLLELCNVNDSNRGDKITYDRDVASAYNQRENCDLIVFQAKPSVLDVIDVADEEGFMPQKSTYFYPKLAAGFTMRRLA